MTITIRYFASVRERVGIERETVDTDAATVGALRRELLARGGAWAEALSLQRTVRAALDQTLVDEEAPLAPGSEVAFFPPVTGG